MHTLLPGYVMESTETAAPRVPAAFVEAVGALHRDLRAPFTMFVRGQVAEAHGDLLRQLRDECGDLVDFQQAGYDGRPMKTVCQEDHRGVTVVEGASPDEIRTSLLRTRESLRQALGISPVGLAAALGCYRGLADRPDLLRVLAESGICFVRSWTRNAHDWCPLSFEVQPFTYAAQGFPQILETPGQGWPDDLLRETLGYAETGKYLSHVRKDLDYVAAKGLVWSYAQKDWASLRDDPGLGIMRALIEHAQSKGFRILAHRTFYEATVGPIPVAPSPAVEEETPIIVPAPAVAERFVSPVSAASAVALVPMSASAPGGEETEAGRPSRLGRRILLASNRARKFAKPALRKMARAAGPASRRRLRKALGF